MNSEQYCCIRCDSRKHGYYCFRACRQLAIGLVGMIKDIMVLTGLTAMLLELFGIIIDTVILAGLAAMFIEFVEMISIII